MRTISMLEFPQPAEQIIQELRKGERMILTYRGTPVARREPIERLFRQRIRIESLSPGMD